MIPIIYISLALPHWNRPKTVSWAYPITWILSSIIFLVCYNTLRWLPREQTCTA